MTCNILCKLLRTRLFIFPVFLFISGVGYSQPCTIPGQTPSTAFGLCDSTTVRQSSIPSCKNHNLFVPGCSQGYINQEYADRNPFWYRFICSSSGSLGFLIDPYTDDEDFD